MSVWEKSRPASRSDAREADTHSSITTVPTEAVPLDRYGAPKAFAVSLGEGGPFDRLYKGDISWRACPDLDRLKTLFRMGPKESPIVGRRIR